MNFFQAGQFCVNPSQGHCCINGSTAICVIMTHNRNNCPNCPEWKGNECHYSITPTRAPLPPPPPLPKLPPPSCFPSTARVSLESGNSIRMSKLQIGDKIQTGMYGYLKALLKALSNVILNKGSSKTVVL